MKPHYFLFFLLIITVVSCKKDEPYVPSVNVFSYTPAGGAILNDIVFTGSDTGYVSCSNGMVLKTINGGTSWVAIQAAATDISLQFLSFVNSRIGFASGGNAFGEKLYKTTDAGTTWTLLGSNFDYDEIEFVDQNIGYMLNLDQLYKTTNGGTMWTMINPLNSFDYPENVVFLSKDTGFVRDRQGFFYWTTNGGTTFSVNSNSSASSQFISFNKTGRKSGAAFTLTSAYTTSDAGVTWTSHGSWDHNYEAYAFSGRGNNFVVSGDQVLVLSKDGGNTFTNYYNQEGITVQDNLKKNTVTPDGKIFCIGELGHIYRITF
ncbi:hypothetical protein BH11BAC7_BH11BAC7_24930 [soil metagenome]